MPARRIVRCQVKYANGKNCVRPVFRDAKYCPFHEGRRRAAKKKAEKAAKKL